VTTRQPDPLPEATTRFATPEGKPQQEWYRWFWDVSNLIPNIIAIIDAPPPADPEYELIEEFSVVIAYPSAKDYRLVLKAAVARTITEVVTRSVSGTCTATTKVDTTALGGTANSVSSTEQSQLHTTSNAWSVGADLVVTISSVSACVDMTLTVKTTRNLTAIP
jgi:hypothetical protein